MAGGINSHAYVAGNPVNFIDPEGHARKGGKSGEWWEFTDRNFQRWYHQCVKKGGDQDADRGELAEAYAEWMASGRPSGKDGCGPPPSPPAPVCEDCQKTAYMVIGATGATYFVYRCLRMLPSLFPPLWPTIVPNLVSP